jgi:hypothetical protein
MGGGGGKNHPVVKNFRLPGLPDAQQAVDKLVRFHIYSFYIADNCDKERQNHDPFHVLLIIG